METGRTVILLNLESLYESLYDALNQVCLDIILFCFFLAPELVRRIFVYVQLSTRQRNIPFIALLSLHFRGLDS